MNGNRSVETIESPEFIELEPYNPLISKCQIKVLYIGENRNGSYIDKETARKMANTLPTSPIVGAFIDEKDDFGDHGDVITIEDGEVKFSCKTKPYGFVAPDAKAWFQTFIDTDKFGNEVEHEYLMTEGYLWTGQYEEARQIIESGKGQSMELDADTLDGEWATNSKTGVEFFIINDAVFSKLCILGDDVEPCFEGASITAAPTDYTDNYKNFTKTLFSMMNELKNALENNDGAERGSDMPTDDIQDSEVKTPTEEIEAMGEQAKEQEKVVEDSELKTAEEVLDAQAEGDDEGVDFKKKPRKCEADDQDEDDDFKKKPRKCEADEQDDDDFKKKPRKCEADEDDDFKKKRQCTASDNDDQYTMTQLVSEVESLRSENEMLKSELNSLKEFKLQVERDEKDALINKYFMLSDEDKADVIENKDSYTLDEIEAKLALAYVKKNVDFSMSEDEGSEQKAPVAYSFSLEEDGSAEGSDFTADPILEALRSFKEEEESLF